MPQNRFFVDTAFSPQTDVTLKDEELHHLVRVMRVQEGANVELVNGKNQLAHALVEKVTKTTAQLTIQRVENGPKKTQIILVQALPRPAVLDWIMEKGTELNVTEFWLFGADGSEKKSLTETQLNRLKTLRISAMKQCGRLDLPALCIYPNLEEVPAALGTLFFGDLKPQAPSLLEVGQKISSEPVFFFVGPEKGFSEKELALLEKRRAQGVSLSANILRTETAAIAALVLLQEISRR